MTPGAKTKPIDSVRQDPQADGLLKDLVNQAGASKYPPRVELLSQDARAGSVFVLVSGIVKLVYVAGTGREVIIGLRHPGWLIGGSAFVLNEPLPTAIVTLTPCRLVRLDAVRFGQLVRTDARVKDYLLKLHAEDARDHLGRLIDFTCRSAIHRLTKFLLEVAEGLGTTQENKGEIVVPLKQWEIAELLGITPEHLSRLLKKLERQGCVSRRRKTLFVSQSLRPTSQV
jgi:CRP-like cAMP-binding protein